MTECRWLREFADNLDCLLYKAHMTQKDLAIEAGISEGSVSAYMHGSKMPTARALVNMAFALNCSLDELMDFGERIE